MSHTRFLLSVAALIASSLCTVLQAQVKQPIPSEPYLIDQFLPKSTALKKGYFITEGQLESLSPEARAEFEKLLKAKADQATRMKIYEQRVKEEYQTAQAALKRAIAEQQALAKQEQKAYRYMIGVTVEPNEGNEDGGVIVSRVLEDSPAEKAGVAPGDVILSVKGPRKISSPQDLIAAVEDSDGQEIVLRVKTYGKEGTQRSLQIVPVERPDRFKTAETQSEPRDPEVRKQWEQAYQQYVDNNLKFRTIHPGIYWDQTALQQDLPENVTITVSKSGKAPAKIIVTRDAESWNMNETEVDQLPEDLRAPVKRLLNRPAVKSMTPLRNIVETEWQHRNIPATQATTSKELQLIQRQLEALQKAVEKLQQDQQQE